MLFLEAVLLVNAAGLNPKASNITSNNTKQPQGQQQQQHKWHELPNETQQLVTYTALEMVAVTTVCGRNFKYADHDVEDMVTNAEVARRIVVRVTDELQRPMLVPPCSLPSYNRGRQLLALLLMRNAVQQVRVSISF